MESWRFAIYANGLGIIDCSFIGKVVMQLFQLSGCTILSNNILDVPDFYTSYGAFPAWIEEFHQRSDIVKMHLALDDSTLNILSEERLRLMKQTAVLINIVRGGLIGETVLNKMLMKKRLASAPFDVFTM